MTKSTQAEKHSTSHLRPEQTEQYNTSRYSNLLSNFEREVGVSRMTSSESATPQTIDRPPHPDANDNPLRHADNPRNTKSTPYLETQNETADNGCDRILQKENQNNKKTFASILTSSEISPSDEDSERNTDHSVWISKEHYQEGKEISFYRLYICSW